MNAKRPAENDNMDQQSQCKRKKCKKGYDCARCFTVLTENYMDTRTRVYCPKCFEELKQGYWASWNCLALRSMTERHR
ncbi:hypothetical protein TNCV_1826721 [Trichonephila clavipes]|nr:hypothetical protein TNCV_1826341 [Trichonephila clavipes]GFX44810.1 hypothetical protein TNCV_1826721 [Trichonephila clavipes]